MVKLLRVLTVLCVVTQGTTVLSSSRYGLTVLQNPGLRSFQCANEDQCVTNCMNTTGCSAVSYSQKRLTCMVSMCGNLKLAIDALWNTVVLLSSAVIVGCDIPRARDEWMLTDTCGNSSSGYVTDVPDMQAYVPPTSTVPTPGGVYFGNSYNASKVCWLPTNTNNSLHYDFSQSFTMFAYFYPTSNTYGPLLQFHYVSQPNTWTQGMRFWSFNNGPYYNFGASGGSQTTYSCVTNCVNQIQVNYVSFSWQYAAAVYNKTAATVTLYYNGTSQATFDLGGQLQAQNITPVWNYASIGCRRTTTLATEYIPGSIYCVKLFDQALTSQQIQYVAASCTQGSLLFW